MNAMKPTFALFRRWCAAGAAVLARRGLGYNRGDFSTSRLLPPPMTLFMPPPPPLYWDSRNRTNKRAAIAVVAMALTAMSFSVQAQTVNICDRTPQVRDRILARISGVTCNSVPNSRLRRLSTLLGLNNKGIMSLQTGDFSELTNLIIIELNDNNLTELPVGIFSSLEKLRFLNLSNNALTDFPSDAGITRGLFALNLSDNQLSTLPSGIFSGFSHLTSLTMHNNPGSTFRFTVKFVSSDLTRNFTTALVRAVLREGAPRPIAVPLSVTGATLSASTLNFTTGSVRSDAVTVTRTGGNEFFELSQGELVLGGDHANYSGFEIVPGPAVTTASFTHVRARVFLEGALE